MPKALAEQPGLPQEAAYLWQWFLEVKGSAPLTFTELDAWSRLLVREVKSWEVQVIKKLDLIFWDAHHGRS